MTQLDSGDGPLACGSRSVLLAQIRRASPSSQPLKVCLIEFAPKRGWGTAADLLRTRGMPSRRARLPRALVPNLVQRAAAAITGRFHASGPSWPRPWHEILPRPRPPPPEIQRGAWRERGVRAAPGGGARGGTSLEMAAEAWYRTSSKCRLRHGFKNYCSKDWGHGFSVSPFV